MFSAWREGRCVAPETLHQLLATGVLPTFCSPRTAHPATTTTTPPPLWLCQSPETLHLSLATGVLPTFCPPGMVTTTPNTSASSESGGSGALGVAPFVAGHRCQVSAKDRGVVGPWSVRDFTSLRAKWLIRATPRYQAEQATAKGQTVAICCSSLCTYTSSSTPPTLPWQPLVP